MKIPKLSIIMPSLNQGCFIEEAILSVINQDYSNFEFILIDGGSSDNTLNIINKYKKKIEYIISETDNGLYHALNKGILKATGDYIGFINSDDIYETGALKAIGEFLTEKNEIDLVYGIAGLMTKDSKITGYFGDFEFDKNYYFKYTPTIPYQATFFRRDCLAQIGLLDTNLKFGGDTDLWKRFAKFNYKIKAIKKHIANWRIYEDTLSCRSDLIWQRAWETIKVEHRYSGTYFGYMSRKMFITSVALTIKQKKWIMKPYYRFFKKNK